MHGLPAQIGGQPLDFATNLRISVRHISQSVPKHLEIEHGAAYQQRRLTCIHCFLHDPDGIVAKISGRVGLGRIHDIHQLMRVLREGRGVRLAGADVHAPVDLCRIHVDQDNW